LSIGIKKLILQEKLGYMKYTLLNNISVISSLSVFLAEKTGVPGENRRTAISH